MRAVIDSNVLITANGKNHASAECAAACARLLLDAVTSHVVLEDSAGRAFDEYRRYCSLAGQPGVGDQFLKWFLQNRYANHRVVQVHVPTAPAELADSLPAALRRLDNDDHKWVAVYLNGSGEALFNATDSDWGEFADELADAGVNVIEVCAGRS